MRENVAFSVLRATEVIATPTTPLAEHQSSPQTIIEKTWKEGKDYKRVENTVVCHDGESVQV